MVLLLVVGVDGTVPRRSAPVKSPRTAGQVGPRTFSATSRLARSPLPSPVAMLHELRTSPDPDNPGLSAPRDRVGPRRPARPRSSTSSSRSTTRSSRLEASIRRLHAYLEARFPFSWRITIVDNGIDRRHVVAAAARSRASSTASAPCTSTARVAASRCGRRGARVTRRSSRTWTSTSRPTSTRCSRSSRRWCRATPTSRSARGSRRARRSRGYPKREFISRAYNVLLRTVFATPVRDAQCGFKAVRADVARRLLPAIEDNEWFFDTELLLLARHNGLRIHEVPVDWVDDADSRVDVRRTALDDLAGVVRMARTFWAGGGRIDLGDAARPAARRRLRPAARPVRADRRGQHRASRCCSSSLLHGRVGAVAANAVAVTADVRREHMGERAVHRPSR